MRIPADLLVAAQTGDPHALERLLAAAQPDVRRYARRQCHRGSVIEDVVQETLMVIWRRVGSVRDPAAFAGWLITVVTRLCMIPALMLTRGVEELDDVMTSRSLARLPVDDLRIDLARAFESLPPAHREIVLLRDFE